MSHLQLVTTPDYQLDQTDAKEVLQADLKALCLELDSLEANLAPLE